MHVKKLYEKVIIRTLIIILASVFCFKALPVLFYALKPLFYAYFLALLVNPLVKLIDDKVTMKRKYITMIMAIVILIILIYGLFWLAQILISQITGFAIYITRNWSSITSYISTTIDRITESVELLPPIAADIINDLGNNAMQFLSKLRSNIINFAFSSTSNLINTSSSIILFVVTFLMSFYFILLDLTRASTRIKDRAGFSGRKSIYIVQDTILYSAGGYIKAQLMLASFCFIFMAISLGIMGQEYFLLIALFLGIIDLVPLIGAIAIMIPWGLAYILIFNNPNKGFIILGIGIAYFISRKLLEPRALGSSTGLHPILSLGSMYAGYRLVGVWGAIIFPIVAVFIKGIFESGLLENWVYDYKMFYEYIKELLDNGEKQKAMIIDNKIVAEEEREYLEDMEDMRQEDRLEKIEEMKKERKEKAKIEKKNSH